MKKNIIYINSYNVVSARTVEVLHESDTYLNGHCHSTGSYKTFRKDRILGTFSNQLNGQKIVVEFQKKYNILKKRVGTKYNIENKEGVCFTGFVKIEKNELITIAKKNNFQIKPNVSKNVKFLVCGDNAGPSKLKKALILGCYILKKETFLHLLKNKEILSD